jgi:hypothetical protein
MAEKFEASCAKSGFEKHSVRKTRRGKVWPFTERYAVRLMGVQKLEARI